MDMNNRITGEHKRMELQSNLETVQHEQHISRAAKLQCRWLEVSERERQAHIYNRQLLQDFHRAQDTINDLMARTAAMNTLRVEYERHLEQLYPQWRQKLQEQRFSTQRKRLEMHLRECMTRMDDESPEVIPSDAASYSVPSTSQSYRRQEGPTQRPRNTHVVERSNKPKALVNQNSSSPTGFSQMPYTWLTQVNQPIPRTDQMITEPRGAHSSHGIPPPPFNLPHRGEVYNTYAPVHQEPPFVEDDRRENPPYTLSWAGVGEGLAPQAQPNLYGSWPPAGLPMLNPAVWRVMGMPGPSGEDVQSSQGVGQGGSGGGGEDRGPKSFQPPRSPGRGHSPGWGHGMGVNDGTSDQTCELDTRPVRLSGADDESSAASSSSRRSKHKQQEGKRPQRPVMVEKYDTASLQSSAVSQASLVPNLRHEVLSQNTNIVDSPSESAEQTQSISRRSKSTNGTPGQNKGQRENSSANLTSVKQSGIRGAMISTKTQERPQEQTEDETEENEESLGPSVRSDIATGGEDDEDERLEAEDEEEEEEQMNERTIGERVDNGEGAQEEQSEEEDEDEDDAEEDEDVLSHSGQLKASREAASDHVVSDGSQKFQNGNSKKNTTKSSEMNKDKEADKSQSKDDPSEEEEEEEEDEGDDDEDQEEDEVDDDDDEDEKEEEEQHPKNGAINLDDEDGEDDEELYNQEIEDDEDDEVIVDNGYARSEGPKYNFLKYLGEKDEVEDDIEGLLAPKVEVPKQKEMIPKVRRVTLMWRFQRRRTAAPWARETRRSILMMSLITFMTE
ncbi:sarcoplasmic reticulum histidine-rich calcium-binding protein isoform X2 [Alosa alosa]|uniref:sarcoplasmic reticulum histidine-rich calcium-binding protein isoform X2 n=1 Tax=Alosa alosa TaxID=278164 RepID=UPI0020153660|nr:sarcoplasmic reticulum histidine-rich calcium-binding protein isoform X2 [Alosa alosa]